jgi:hypothetical protein
LLDVVRVWERLASPKYILFEALPATDVAGSASKK